MKSKTTLYINIGMLTVGIVLTILGLILYFGNKPKRHKTGFNKYLILPIVGLVLTGLEILQIIFYIMAVKKW